MGKPFVIMGGGGGGSSSPAAPLPAPSSSAMPPLLPEPPALLLQPPPPPVLLPHVVMPAARPAPSAPPVGGASSSSSSKGEGRCIVGGSSCTGSTNFILEGKNPATGRPYTRNDGGACRECARVDPRFAGSGGGKDSAKCRSARRDWCQWRHPETQASCREEACFVDERTGCYARCSTHSKAAETGARLPNLRRAEHFACQGQERARVPWAHVLDGGGQRGSSSSSSYKPQDLVRVCLPPHNKLNWAKVVGVDEGGEGLDVWLLCESQASFRELKGPGGEAEWWCKRHAKQHPGAVPMRGKRGLDWKAAYQELVARHGPHAYPDNRAPKRVKKDGCFRIQQTADEAS